jgi:hypothetical protein
VDVPTVTCPCGCGRTFDPIGSRGRPRSFFSLACSLRVNRVSGGGEGRRHTLETRTRLSELARRPKPWLCGERNGMAGRTGSSNPNWKGGGTPERQKVYASAEWRKVRRLVRDRAACMCELCGSTDHLHVHHIKGFTEFPTLRLDPDNLMLLCRGCHIDEHRKGVNHQ